MNDIKTVKSLESGLLIKDVTETINNKIQNNGLLSIVLGKLVASFLETMLAGKGVVRSGDRNRTGQDF